MSVQLFSLLFSIAFILIVLDLVRRQRLKEQYSLLWLLVGIGLLLVSSSTRVLEGLASLLAIKYAPAVLFLLGLIFCFALILHLTVVISKLTDRVLRLTQEVTVLKTEITALQTASESASTCEKQENGEKEGLR